MGLAGADGATDASKEGDQAQQQASAAAEGVSVQADASSADLTQCVLLVRVRVLVGRGVRLGSGATAYVDSAQQGDDVVGVGLGPAAQMTELLQKAREGLCTDAYVSTQCSER